MLNFTLYTSLLYFLEDPSDKKNNALLRHFTYDKMNLNEGVKVSLRMFPRTVNTLLILANCGRKNNGIDLPLTNLELVELKNPL